MATADGDTLPRPAFYSPVFSAFSIEKAAPSASKNSALVPVPSGTDNTRHVQATGLGPSTLDPGDALASDPARMASPFSEIGASGLAQYGGFVRDEFLPQLQGDQGLRTWREMFDNDAIVGALVFAVQMLMRKVEWRVEPPEAPSVEGIVAARQKERMKTLLQQHQAIAAQAAQGAQGSGAGATAGQRGPTQPPLSHQPTPELASPLHEAPAPFHRPLGEAPSPTAATGNTHPFQPAPTGTPDNRPGANAQPNAATSPSTNFPARPNSPTSNPGGGPNQAGALGGTDGLPGARGASTPSPLSPGNDTEIGGLPKKPLLKALEPLATIFDSGYDERVEKAGSGGQFVGGIEALDVGPIPVDPETGEPMEFPLGTGPLDAPSPQEQKAQELAVLVETAIHDTTDSWADLISQIITMIVFGFSFHEIVYKKRNGPNPDDPSQGSRFSDGKIGWAKIAGRAQETRHRWEFDEYGNTLGMWQLAPPKFQLKYIPMSKALLFRTTGYKGNPEGRSILRSAYRSWYLKRRIEEIEAIGVERNLAGIPVAYVPYQWLSALATDEEKAALDEVKRIVRNVRNDEQAGLVLPSMFDPDTKQPIFKFELISAASGSSSKVQDTDKIITRYDQRIAMVALVDFILLGHESVGSKALADTKADLFTTALEAWLNVIADVFNTNAIPRLMQMNGEDPAMAPRLTFGQLARVNLNEMAQLITALAAAGADLFPDSILEDHIRSEAGLPAKSATDDL